MELRHLRYFLAVGEALNFTKAAAQLRVAQPTSSRTTGRSQPQRLPRVLSVYRASFPPSLSQTADRGGMRQRELAHHGSGVRRDRASDHGLQTRGRQAPPLSSADRHDGPAAARWYRPRHKG